jgi:hypothetical protein
MHDVSGVLKVSLANGESTHGANFLATAAVFVVRELLARLSVCLLLIGPSLAILIGIYGTVAFQGSHELLALIWVDVIAAVVIVMAAFIQMDRDATLSLVSDTVPGKLDWSFDLVSKFAVYALLPLLALFASQFPNIGTSIAEVFRSVPGIP